MDIKTAELWWLSLSDEDKSEVANECFDLADDRNNLTEVLNKIKDLLLIERND